MAGPDAEIDEDVIHVRVAYSQIPGRERCRRPLGLGSFVGEIDPTRLASQMDPGSSSAPPPPQGSGGGDGPGGSGASVSLAFIHDEIIRLTQTVERNNADTAEHMARIREDVRHLYELTGHVRPPTPPPPPSDPPAPPYEGGDYFVDHPYAYDDAEDGVGDGADDFLS